MAVNLDNFPLAIEGQKTSGISVFELDTLMRTDLLVKGRAYRTPCYMLLLITEGQGQHHIDSQAWPYQRGTLFEIGVGQMQVFDWAPKTAGYQIMFTDQYCASHSSDLSWFYGMSLFDPATETPVLYLSQPVYRAVSWIAQRLKDLVSSEMNTLQRQLQWQLLKTLLLEIEGERVNHGYHVASGRGEVVLYGRFRELLERNFQHCRCVRTYAKLLHVTPKKLNKVIQQQLGCSAKQVIDERVVAEIQRLLMYTTMTIQEIGYRLGFSEPGYIIKFFKRHSTYTPAQYKSANKPLAHSYHHSADTDLLQPDAITDDHDSMCNNRV